MKIFRFIAAIFAMVSVSLLAACGGGGGSPGSNPNQPTLTTTAPAAITMAPGVSEIYQVSGGVPPYRVGNSSPDVASGSLDGTKLTITAHKKSGGASIVEVIDHSGAKISISVNVTDIIGPLRTTAPSPVVLLPDSGVQYEIAGGSPPYRVNSSDNQIATASVVDKKLQINGKMPGDTVINVQDAAGTTVQISVKVGSSVELTTTAPSPVVLTPGSTGRYDIAGGVQPYRVATSNAAVAVGEVAGNTLSIRAIALGKANLDVIDKVGTRVSVSVTVSAGTDLPLTVAAPSPVTLFPGASAQYDILGGLPPYRVSSSNTQAVNASTDGSRLMLSAVAAGKANITVVDSAGARVEIEAVVASSAPLTTSAPAALTIGVGPSSTRTFSIQGGVPPYSIQGSNQNVFTVTGSGSSFSVTGVAIGGGTLSIRDAAGTQVDIAVTVGAPQLRISPDKLKIVPGVDAVAKISGGQPPYRVAGGIPSAIEATVVGDELRIRGLLASKLDLSVADATGQTVKVEVEVEVGTVTFNIMPGALAITEDDNQNIRLRIYGAAPGRVCFYTDRTQLQPLETGCPVNPTGVTLVTGSAGSRCVNGNTNVLLTAVDSTGAVATSVITIVDNGGCAAQPPQPLTASANTATVTTAAGVGATGTSTQLLIFGGSGQYGATSSNSGAATATITGNVLTITGGTTAGTATVTVFDQQRPSSSLTINVTAN